MKTITLKDVVASQNAQVAQRGEDTRFVGDYETIEFSNGDYDLLVKTDTDHQDDTLYETVIGMIDNDFYKITAKTSSFNGEKQVSFSRQQLTLQGFNSYTKELDDDKIDREGIYNNYLSAQGYDFTMEDILQLGELSSEYNCTTLKFKNHQDDDVYITINSHNQLSKITVKLSKRKVNSNSSMTSAFNF